MQDDSALQMTEKTHKPPRRDDNRVGRQTGCFLLTYTLGILLESVCLTFSSEAQQMLPSRL
eukprot:scaffold8705_cov140-Amphora_coffeaeformis.AAC.2